MTSSGHDIPLPSRIVSALKAVIGPGPVGLHEPVFRGQEWTYLKDCLDSTYVSSVGRYVDRFEEGLSRLTGAEHSVAVVNGTAALHIGLRLAGVQAGDEVLIPALTFVATACAVIYCNAVPHFVDSEESTLGISPKALHDHLRRCTQRRGGNFVNRHTGRPIRALVPMHTFGHPADLYGLLDVAEEFELALVEDAAESLGSFYYGHHTGTLGRIGVLSFNGNKTITTGGGGALLLNDSDLAQRAKHLTTTAKLPHRWEFRHDEIGYNYRLPNINAALGCAQLEQLDAFLQSKRKLYSRYSEAFSDLPGMRLVNEPQGSQSNFWLQAILLDESAAHERDLILAATNDAGYMTRPAWTVLHRLPPYSSFPRAQLPVAESLEQRLINIPSGAGLAESRYA